MTMIKRDIDKAKSEKYDLIIIGTGFYGIMLAYESACRGLKTLLLEKNDFGSATSFNSLRIVHGGLRYLQSLDLHRFRESVEERKWFLKNFPDLTKPVQCLMPLYNKGMQRNPIMWAALNVNDLLSITRNSSVSEKNTLLNGKIVSANKVKEIFPKVSPHGLKGGAVWSDGSMDDSQIVLLEVLKAAVDNGCTPLNYTEVKSVICENTKISGVTAIDVETKQDLEFHAPLVINSTGPWSRDLGKKFHKDFEELFRYSIAWNILFNVDRISDYALAVTPPRDNAKAYFLRPWKGRLFAGTIHETWDGVSDTPIPSKESIQNFINDLNLSIPDLNVTQDDILQIYSGLLPAKKQGSNQIAVKEIIIDHSEHGGPEGLFSLSGVKFTTARLVAEKVLKKVFKNKSLGKRKSIQFARKSKEEYGIFEFDWNINKVGLKDILRNKICTESVVHLQDLLLRRTTLGDNPILALKYAKEISGLFDWDNEKIQSEIKDLEAYYAKRGLVLVEDQGIKNS